LQSIKASILDLFDEQISKLNSNSNRFLEVPAKLATKRLKFVKKRASVAENSHAAKKKLRKQSYSG
jgi:hypothetical protein